MDHKQDEYVANNEERKATQNLFKSTNRITYKMINMPRNAISRKKYTNDRLKDNCNKMIQDNDECMAENVDNDNNTEYLLKEVCNAIKRDDYNGGRSIETLCKRNTNKTIWTRIRTI